MPRNTDGSYTLPAGSLVAVGEDIVPSQHNPPLQDLASAMADSLSRDGRGGMRANLQGGGFRGVNFAAGVQPTDLVILSQLASGAGGVPVGAMMDYAGATAPTGWLICAGQTLSRTSYAELFAVIGTAWGAPSGSTFSLPDLRGRVSAGLDIDQGGFAGRLTTPNSQTLGAAGGAQTVTLTAAQMPAHTHSVTGTAESAGAHTHTVASATSTLLGSGTEETAAVPDTATTSSSGAHTHTVTGTAASAGSGEAHSNVQPTIIVNKIIKASSS